MMSQTVWTKYFMKNVIIKKFFLFTLICFITSESLGQTRIMPLGNSITQGIHGSDPVGGYRDDLYLMLEDINMNVDFVGSMGDGDPSIFDRHHEGHGGYFADEILAKVRSYVKNANPEIILLHIGTNDISNDETPESTIVDISQILFEIKRYNPSMITLLASVIPRNDNKDSYNSELNVGIKQLVPIKQQEGYNVHYVPIHEAFLAHSNWRTALLDDTVHPNNEGYNIMSQEFFSAIMAISNPPLIPDHFLELAGNNQTGQINSILPTPLTIQVLSENNEPVSNISIEFEIQNGNGSIIPNTSDKFISLEAEAANIQTPCFVDTDMLASNGEYVVSEVIKSGSFSHNFQIEETDQYWIWGRIFAQSDEEDSYFVVTDTEVDTILWDLGYDYYQWKWIRLSDRDKGDLSFNYSEGEHFIEFITREINSRLDKIIITNNPNYIPQGISGFPHSITNSNGESSVLWQLGNVIGLQEVVVTSREMPGEQFVLQANATPDQNTRVSISGKLSYYSNQSTISNFQVTLNDTGKVNTNEHGEYQFSNLIVGKDYSLKPFLSNSQIQDCIISYDAAMTARYAVGLLELEEHQKLAADVNQDSTVQMFDAALIAQYVIGLNHSPQSLTGNWHFIPDSLHFNNLNSEITEADFSGIIYGDVHGGWVSDNLTKETSQLINYNCFYQQDTLIIKLPLQLTEPLFSIDLHFQFDPIRFNFNQIKLINNTHHFTTYRHDLNGNMKISSFNPYGDENIESILIKFLCNNNDELPPIKITSFRLNQNSYQETILNIDNHSNQILPNRLVIKPNYPNPFNGSTIITFYLPNSGSVKMTLFNLLGQIIWRQEKHYNDGWNSYKFNADNLFHQTLSSGDYFISIDSEKDGRVMQSLKYIK